MTAVRISSKPGGGYTCFVDGVDVGMHIAAGISVQFPEDFTEPVAIFMTVLADEVDLDLPEAVLMALRDDPEADAEADA